MQSLLRFATVLVLLGCLASSAAAAPPAPLQSLDFLLGEWTGAGGGAPGQATGKTLFTRGLQDRVLLRTNEAVYPASGDRPASRHDDFMIVYVASDTTVHADYYDNEGHVVRYAVTSPAAGEAIFVSTPSDREPRYRLSYKLAAGGSEAGTFEIAPPGKPNEFKTYLTWESQKVGAGAGK